ncbi:MAG: hypothetical protein ICV68_03675, partial [Pyrinomonadaceae bacterium]|nr:hypothetical protein [Pyrinomonadaceae bacterium]
APDAALYPELKLPVIFFRSNAAATHGEVSLDTTRSEVPGGVGLYADTRPRDNELTTPPRIFIVMTPAALDPEDKPYTQKVLAHEYVHFQQKLNRTLMVRPDCPVNWKGSPLGGNPNREILAVKATFTRFFPAWADTVTTEEPKDFPRHIIQDLKFLQAYFPCVEPAIQTDVISSIAATADGKPTRHRLLLQMVQAVRAESLPSLAVSEENNGMARLAKALGAPLSRDERLPGPPPRPTFGPLFDINEFKARGSERMGQRLGELEP